MFGKKIWILAIAEDKIIAARVNVRSKKVIKALKFNWKSGELSDVVGEVKKKIKTNNVRILLADNLSYFFGLLIPEDLTGSERREFIQKKIEERVPEQLKPGQWDYKEAGFKGEKRKVVIFAPVKRIYFELVDTVRNNNLVVEAVESESIAHSRHANPLVGIALKQDIAGEDEVTLNIDLQQSLDKTKISRSDKENKRRSFSVFFKIALTVLLAIVTVGGAYYFFQLEEPEDDLRPASADNQIVETTIEPTQADTEPTPTPIPLEELNLSEYNILIQNGSGIAGEAGYVEEILLAEGFENIETGNAEDQDHQQTIVRHKEDVNPTILDIIDRALNGEYNLLVDDTSLDDSEEYDVHVIVGERSET